MFTYPIDNELKTSETSDNLRMFEISIFKKKYLCLCCVENGVEFLIVYTQTASKKINKRFIEKIIDKFWSDNDKRPIIAVDKYPNKNCFTILKPQKISSIYNHIKKCCQKLGNNKTINYDYFIKNRLFNSLISNQQFTGKL